MASNFEVKNEEIEATLKSLGMTIDKALPEGWGFALTIQSYGPKGSTFYVSNCDRRDMVKMFRELILKLKWGK